MIGLLIQLLIILIVGGLLWWAVNKILGIFGAPPQVVGIVQVIFVVVLVIILLTILVPLLAHLGSIYR